MFIIIYLENVQYTYWASQATINFNIYNQWRKTVQVIRTHRVVL